MAVHNCVTQHEANVLLGRGKIVGRGVNACLHGPSAKPKVTAVPVPYRDTR